MRVRLAASVLCLLCATMSAQTASDEAEIRAARRLSNEAMNHKDILAFGLSLDSDFVMVRGNGVLVPSKQAYIETFARDFADAKAVKYQRITDKVETSGAAPLAAEHGHWIGSRPDGKQAYGGTYLAMWRKTASGWKIRSELFVLLACGDEAACAAYSKP